MLDLQGSQEKTIATLIERFNLACLALTMGADGSILCSRDGSLDRLPACKTQVLDTVGAGDAFAAALAVGLIQNKPMAQTHLLASRSAAHVCSVEGAMAALPDTLTSPFHMA